jgi:hypothetical protein
MRDIESASALSGYTPIPAARVGRELINEGR